MAAQARVIVPVTDDGNSTLEGAWRAHANLARLKTLHAEAAETASLANLLGRSIPVASALIVCALAAAIFADAAHASAIAWGGLLLPAAGAIGFSYNAMIREAFVHGTLRKFAHNLDAIMLYAGFAWGAGAYLVLPADAGIAGFSIFAGGMTGLVACLLRARKPVLLFAGPVALLAGAAPLLRTAPGDLWTAAAVLGVCAAVAIAVEIAHKMRVVEAKLRETGLFPA